MARIIKQLGYIAVFVVVLCGNSVAQSTFNSTPSHSDINSVSLAPVRPTVHGFGVVSLSSYYPDSSFQKAYKLAVEDLNASLFTSVYLESFKASGHVRNHEFAITDTLSPELIVKLDSLQHDGKAYIMVGVDSSTDESLSPPANVYNLSTDNWTNNLFTPYETGGFWIASGKEKLSQYNPYKSWAKSKLNALSRLSNVLQTKVQSSVRSMNASYQEITYIASKNLFSNIIVLKRTIKGEYCYTLLAVHTEDIIQLNQQSE